MTLNQLADLIETAPLPIVADACEEAGLPWRAAYFRAGKGGFVRAMIADRFRRKRPYRVRNVGENFVQTAIEWNAYLATMGADGEPAGRA